MHLFCDVSASFNFFSKVSSVFKGKHGSPCTYMIPLPMSVQYSTVY